MNIKSECIKMYLMVKFNKKIEDIGDNELQTVTSLPISGIGRDIYFEDLLKFNNLIELNIDGVNLMNEDFEVIKVLKLKSLSLYRCSFESFDFLNDMKCLKKLHIISPFVKEALSLQFVNSNISELILEDCLVDNFENLINCNNLKILSVIKTYLPDNFVNIVNNLKMLKILFISSGYDISNIKNKELLIYNDYINFAYDDYEEKESNKLV